MEGSGIMSSHRVTGHRSTPEIRSKNADRGDRICCAAFVVAALAVFLLLAWHIGQIPIFH